MIKSILLVLFALLFSACSATTYNFNKNEEKLTFKIEEDNFFNVLLQNQKVTSNFDRCTSFSETIQASTKYGKIFVENINLDYNCNFTQDSLWAFLSEFRDNLKLKSFQKVEKFKYKNYEFYTFKIDDEKYVNFIFISSVLKTTFIVDYSGRLSQNIISQFDDTIKLKYSDISRFDANYDYSLVRFNFFKSYFGKISGDKFD